MDSKTSHIQIAKFQGFTAMPKANVHLLPFKIRADTDAKVDKYFTKTIEQDSEGVLKASLRGYPLSGTIMKVPDGYRGIVLDESMCIEKKDRSLFITDHFDEFVYWNWSKPPSKNDAIQQVMDWIDIAEALHSPIDEE